MTTGDGATNREEGIRPKVVVLNPYLPTYRVPFFLHLQEVLALKGLELELVTGKPTDEFRQRDDFASLPFHHVQRGMSINFFPLRFRYLFAKSNLRQADVVVYEFSITNMNTWKALLLPRKHKAILWGHGPGYLSKENAIRLMLQKKMARKADLILTYTEPGRARVISLGIADHRVIAVNNTIQTKEISEAIESLSLSEVEEFRQSLSLGAEDKVLAFIGALDKTKRIDFLEKVLDDIWALDKTFKLLVGGAGSQRYRFNESIQRGQTQYLGRVGAKEKALIATVSKGLINPGNTGLLAVDALVMNVPIFGTEALSSPEKDYLKEGSSFFTLANSPHEFATGLLDLLETDLSIETRGSEPKLQNMVETFSSGIVSQTNLRELKKLLVVTNLPAPYRISLFEELAKFFALTVAYTGWREEGRMWGETLGETSAYETVTAGKMLGVGRFKIPFPAKELKQLVIESDVVLTGGWHSPAFAWSIRTASKRRKLNILWFESTLNSSRFQKGIVAFVRQRLFAKADAVFVPGKAAALAAKKYSRKSQPIVVMSNPLQREFLERAKNLPSKSESIGLKYLYFGRLLNWKRVDLLIEAFEMVADKNDTLTIVGMGPARSDLELKSSRSSVKNKISFEDAVPDSEAMSIYFRHDVLVLPSSGEVWGLVVPEALILGLQAVASDDAGASDAFKEFPTLHSFKSGSVEDLADKLRMARTKKRLSEGQLLELLAKNSPQIFAQKMSDSIEILRELKQAKSEKD